MIIIKRKYDEINFDTHEIHQSLLDISKKKRSNLFAWNGQFSPQFIETLIDNYSDSDFTVLDPFLGSGTVLFECARKNMTAVGVELNPSAFYMAKIYELCSLDFFQRNNLTYDIDGLIAAATKSEDTLSTLQQIAEQNQTEQIGNTISLLVILLDLFNNELSNDLLRLKWNKLKDIIVGLPFSNQGIVAFQGDARALPLEDDAIDLVITSPPYINVFNYHQKYRRSVEALGYDVLKIARQEVGSNRKNRGNRLLTVIQYCIDMALAINEMSRVCKENARIILVVGRESNVLSTPFCNSELIYNVAHGVLGLPLIQKQQRAFFNQFGQKIYEDILHFQNQSHNAKPLDKESIVGKARQVAVSELDQKSKSNSIPEQSRMLFFSAIDKAGLVLESEGLC